MSRTARAGVKIGWVHHGSRTGLEGMRGLLLMPSSSTFDPVYSYRIHGVGTELNLLGEGVADPAYQVCFKEDDTTRCNHSALLRQAEVATGRSVIPGKAYVAH